MVKKSSKLEIAEYILVRFTLDTHFKYSLDHQQVYRQPLLFSYVLIHNQHLKPVKESHRQSTFKIQYMRIMHTVVCMLKNNSQAEATFTINQVPVIVAFYCGRDVKWILLKGHR